MPVINVVKDLETRTLTVTARFAAPLDRIWELWSDPRQLERWWGPPGYPATVTEHDLSPDGAVLYFMTGPDGERHHGHWRVRKADPPRTLELEDRFADAHGKPLPDGPTAVIRVALSPLDEGTRMEVITTWDSDEAMAQMLATGTDAGLTAAVGQIDALLGPPARS